MNSNSNHLDFASNGDEDIINSATSIGAIVSALGKRGCTDLTSAVNPAACRDLPSTGGGFCDVYRGELNDGTEIAIKCLRVYDGPEADARRKKILKHAARELYHWSKLRHPNVLPLLGFTLFRGHISMVSEWMDNGSVVSFLMRNPNAKRIGLCMDICIGLVYIHANGMVHGDLKAANVIVSPRGVAMITDFGSAWFNDSTLQFSNTTTKHAFSVRWAAPEILLEDHGSRASKPADVYAYGMTALEVLTGEVPFNGIDDLRVMLRVAYESGHPPRPDTDLGDGLWELLKSCWTRNPAERPSIASVMGCLQGRDVGGATPTSASLEPAKVSSARIEFGDNPSQGLTCPGNSASSANEIVVLNPKAAMFQRALAEGAKPTEGLYAHTIDETWHCSNCGCPGSISVRRRKGPFGQGTMCGECGKYWHKHRKPRPVDYNTNIRYHLNLRKQAKTRKRANKDHINANPSPSKTPSAHGETLANMNNPLSLSPPPQRSTPLPFIHHGSPASQVGTHTQDRQYTDDRVILIAKPRTDENAPPEFRLKCLDCPGKLYMPGPEVSNFEVHLKNRIHRANVNRRVAAEAGGSGVPVSEGRMITPSAPTPAQN